MPRNPAGFVCALGFVASLAGRTGAAELELAEPALCTSVDELSFRVSRAIEQPFESVHGPHFAVEIRQDAQGYHARLAIAGSAGGAAGNTAQRRLNAASCDEMADALALAIALALSSSSTEVAAAEIDAGNIAPGNMAAAAVVPAAAPSEPPSAVPPPAVPEPDTAPSGEAAGRDASGPRLGFALSALADTGSLPGAGLGASLGVRLRWPSLELRAEALLLAPRQAQIADSDPTSPGAGPPGAELSLIAGALLACTPLSGGKSIAVSACAGAELGQLSGEGTHVPVSYEEQRLWAAARVDFAGRWALPELPLGLELIVTLAAPLVRDEFILKDIGTVYQPPNVVARAALGLNWQLE